MAAANPHGDEPAATAGPGLSISRELIRSAKWNAVAAVVRNACALAGMIVLARFLGPNEFGMAAIATSVGAFLLLLGQFGFAQALIGIRHTSKRMTDSIFAVSLLLSGVLYVLVAFAAKPISNFYDNPQLVPMLLLVAAGLFTTLLGAVPMALLQRDLNYKAQAQVAMVTAITMLASTVLLAASGAGVWALLVPPLVGGAAGSIVAFVTGKYLPALAWDWGDIRGSMNFGISALISNVSNFFCNNGIPLVLGKIWSPPMLGIFKFATNSQNRFYDLTLVLISGSVFPIFSRVAHDLPRARNAFLRLTRLSLYLTLPAHVLGIIATPDLFPLLFGAQWNEAIVPFQVLMLASLWRSFNAFSNGTLYALGRPDLSARVVLIRVAGYGAVMLAAALGALGLLQTVTWLSVAEVVVISAYLVTVLRELRCPVGEYARSMMAPVAAAVCVGAVCLLALAGVSHLIDSALASLATIFVVGTLYLGVVAWTVPEIPLVLLRKKSAG